VKRKRFLKLLGIGVILTVLVSVFLPVSPAFAAAGISIDPDEGRIGDEVEVEGVDFDPISSDAPVEYRYVDIYFTAKTTTGAAPSTSSDIDDEIRTYELLESGVDADIDGEFTFSFDVPDRLRDGSVDADVRGGREAGRGRSSRLSPVKSRNSILTAARLEPRLLSAARISLKMRLSP